MYKKDDLIVYGTTGVCRITDIVSGGGAMGDEGPYYVLKPIYEDCMIYTPVNGKMFMRPVISREEAIKLIDAIPGIQAEAYYNNRTQELSQHYQSLIDEHDCGELIELTMSLYEKKQAASRQKRKLGQVDERYMRRAEELLYGELAVALGIEKEAVVEFIRSRVESDSEKE